MDNLKAARLTIVGDVNVTVPASLKYMTTYVLQEQNDWFEDEIQFIRHLVKPGMKAIDIGANYGLYTLSIANIAGNTGRIWAFEPAQSTSSYLKLSIEANNYSNVTLIQSGLSNRLGEAKLYLSPNSELNSLSKELTSGEQFEKVSLLTLDHCKHKYNWTDIDFIKLDAEGEESNILKKGKKTLSSLSPLIMYELKHGNNINLPLIQRFRNMGYESYRLVPGLNTLIPFDHKADIDKYLLNLFCCKEDKATALEKGGYLVRNWPANVPTDKLAAKKYIEAKACAEILQSFLAEPVDDASVDYFKVLNDYAMSLSNLESMSDRVGCLMSSLKTMKSMMQKGPQGIERLTTFARIAFDAGERALGIKILSSLINQFPKDLNFEINEIFLPPSRRYDEVKPGGRIREWLLASILEQYIVKHAYSTYFTQGANLSLFDTFDNLGFMNKEMQRRYELMKMCYSH